MKKYYTTENEYFSASGTRENLLCSYAVILRDEWILSRMRGDSSSFNDFINDAFNVSFKECSYSYAKKHNYVSDMQAMGEIAYACGGIGIGKYGGKMKKREYLEKYIQEVARTAWPGH